MLGCSVADAIVRVPEFDGVVVATRRKHPFPGTEIFRFPIPIPPPGKLAGKGVTAHGMAAVTATSLLSAPSADAEEFSKVLKRTSCSYQDFSERFRTKDRSYGQQYSQIYFTRLSLMSPLLVEAARGRWGECTLCVCQQAIELMG